MTEAPFAVEPARVRHPPRGYAMASAAALLWAVHGTVSKVVRQYALSARQLAEIRSTGACLGESLTAVQLLGAPVVRAGIAFAQTARL